jgi:D(-)-tartrate dehydratase
VRIVALRLRTLAVGGAIRNAAIGFDGMTASALALVTDQVVDGRPLVGLGFDSIGRYGSAPLVESRFGPRLRALDPALLDDPVAVRAALLRDEKPGGHGERSIALGLIDAALWDLAAKRAGVPLWRLLAARFGMKGAARVPVYASGGHYRAGDDRAALAEELRACIGRGHTRLKIKYGGLPPDADRRRLEAALRAAEGAALAVDLTGACGTDPAALHATLATLRDLPLAWIEEPVDPLDLALHEAAAAATPTPIATGENLFDAQEVTNLLRHGGLRPARDLLQMDVGFCGGIAGALPVLAALEAGGWPRARWWPHAGHLFAVHAVAGLGLGGHETAMDPASPFGGITVEAGEAAPPEAPGLGFEAHRALAAVFEGMLD